jgi:hypothetical protein
MVSLANDAKALDRLTKVILRMRIDISSLAMATILGLVLRKAQKHAIIGLIDMEERHYHI